MKIRIELDECIGKIADEYELQVSGKQSARDENCVSSAPVCSMLKSISKKATVSSLNECSAHESTLYSHIIAAEIRVGEGKVECSSDFDTGVKLRTPVDLHVGGPLTLSLCPIG